MTYQKVLWNFLTKTSQTLAKTSRLRASVLLIAFLKICNIFVKMSSLLVDYIAPRHASTLKIVGMANPTAPQDAATKQYVDLNSGTGPGSTVVFGNLPVVSTTTGSGYIVSITPASGTTSGYIDGTANTLGASFTFTGAVNVRSPLSATEAANRDYVDNHATGAAATVVYGSTPVVSTTTGAGYIISIPAASGTTSGYISGTSNTLGATLVFTDTTDSSSTNSGAVQLRGGLAVAKNVDVGGAIYLPTALATAAPLNFYSIYDDQGDLDFSIFMHTQLYSKVVDLKFTRVGRMVTFTWDFGSTGKFDVPSTYLAYSSTVAAFNVFAPDPFLPDHAFEIPAVHVVVNSVEQIALLVTNPLASDNLYIQLNSAFTNAVPISIYNGSISYTGK
jgi:hypothetical protein